RHDLAPLTLAVVKGVLSPILQETVNFINAVALAKERGIKLSEAKSSQEEEFVSLIELEIKTDKETRSICGTLSANKQPRVVKINQYYVELSPYGEMIFIQNLDKPGIIGNLGTLLGKHGINIAAMTFGRDKRGGRAISVLNVDTSVSAAILAKIKKLENILTVKVIKL
ncbi:MAG: ACT domain-containing protein, partial [Candidatus Omnitrophota bacterium]|nr:ACT domain-containing protein [Candidatus Omnitrophota bacterium]